MRYSTSWTDRLVNWLKKLPGPYWLACLVPGLFIFLIDLILYFPADFTINPEAGITQSTVIGLFGLLGFGAAYVIYMLGELPAQISGHLQKIRPILKVSDEEYQAIHDRIILRNIPGGSIWLGQRVVLLISLVTLISLWLTMAGAGLKVLLFVVVFVLSLLLLIFLSILVLIRIGNVSRQIIRLQYQPLEVNILNPFPLFAISRLTQVLALYVLPIATAVGFLAISLGSSTWRGYTVLRVLPSFGETIILLLLILLGPALLLVSLFIFMFPVLWIRRLIIEKKQETLEKLAARLQATFSEYSRRTANGEWAQVSDLTASVEFLTAQEERYRKIVEWPWEGRIFREFIGALGVPILLWLMQAYLQNYVNALAK